MLFPVTGKVPHLMLNHLVAISFANKVFMLAVCRSLSFEQVSVNYSIGVPACVEPTA